MNNTSLRDVFDKGPKYREPKSINWKSSFNIFYGFGRELYHTMCKVDKKSMHTFSKFVKAVRSVKQTRITTITWVNKDSRDIDHQRLQF